MTVCVERQRDRAVPEQFLRNQSLNAAAVRAQPASRFGYTPPVMPSAIGPDLAYRLVSVGEPSLSPDGSLLSFVRSEADGTPLKTARPSPPSRFRTVSVLGYRRPTVAAAAAPAVGRLAR